MLKQYDTPPKGEAFLRPLNDDARELAQTHLSLAQRLAWKLYQSSARIVPLDELRGEALYALVYAAGMFDGNRGVPFGAYATMAITHRLIQAVNVWRRGGRLAHARFTDLTAAGPYEFDTPCLRTRESIEYAAVHELLDQVRRNLPPRWFQALQLYYAQGHTLEEVGVRLGVTRERVRQLLSKAMVRVRRRMPAQEHEMDCI
jgi:RNA polymerase sigma factor (sigma-70 family)